MVWLNVIFSWLLRFGFFQLLGSVYYFHQLWKSFDHHFFKYIFCSTPSPFLQGLQLHAYWAAWNFSTDHSWPVHFLIGKKIYLCFIVDSFYLITMSSSSPIFSTTMSSLLLISSNIFLISDFVVFISACSVWVFFYIFYVVTCSIFPLPT